MGNFIKKILFIFVCFSSLSLVAKQHTDKHILVFLDGYTKEALAMTTVKIEELSLKQYSDINAKIYLYNLKPNVTFTVEASYMGYKDSHKKIKHYTNNQIDTILLYPRTYAFDDVVVTGEISKQESGITKIKKDALEYIPTISLKDVFSLTAGGLFTSSSLNNVQQAQMREVGLSSNSTLGTSIILDGAPLSNNANLMTMANHNQALESRSTMNQGLDLRNISVEHLESIEIVQGIPSVQYGDITSGLVILKTKAGISPYEIRLQSDPYTKLASISKGMRINKGNNLYIGADYTYSSQNIRNPTKDYSRITTILRHSYTGDGNKALHINNTLNYTSALDRNKFDEETMLSKESYNGAFHNILFNTEAFKQYGNKSRLSITSSLNIVVNNIKQEKYISTITTIHPDKITDYEGEGRFLPKLYFTTFETKSLPINYFLSIKNNNNILYNNILINLLTGLDLRYNKNLGQGTIYDSDTPPNPNSTTSSRPIAYKNIPASAPLSLFAEGEVKIDLAYNWKNKTRLGLRSTYDLNLFNTAYTLSKKIALEPRIYTSFTSPLWKVFHQNTELRFSFGYGEHVKSPTLAYLYPEPAYIDIVELNYAHSNDAYKLVWLKTLVKDRKNITLDFNKERKFEMGIGLSYAGIALDINVFKHISVKGFEYKSELVYTPYTKYRYPEGGFGEIKADISMFSNEHIDEISLYSIPNNSVKTIKQGIEYVLSLPKINSIKTRLTLQGAYYHTTYANSQPIAYRPSLAENGKAYPYIGFYNGRNDYVMQRFHSLLRSDTHIPLLKLIFSSNIQAIWFSSRQNLPYDSYPLYWADEYNVRHRADEIDTRLEEYLIQKVDDKFFLKDITPLSISCNIKVTKEIGKHFKISFFVNNIWSYDPIYQTNYKTKVQNRKTAFFGSEIRIKI